MYLKNFFKYILKIFYLRYLHFILGLKLDQYNKFKTQCKIYSNISIAEIIILPKQVKNLSFESYLSFHIFI